MEPNRDQLALERTRLANERTLLAYLRTALALLAMAAALLHFFDGDAVITAFAWCSVVLGLTLLLTGALRYRRVNRRLVDNS